MNLELFIIRIPVILIALTVHEYPHGWVAYLRGDTTARNSGRLTLNPLAHLDFFGAAMMLLGPFGWAKPVPVNADNLYKPRRDMIFVAAAGPLSNIVMAIGFGLLIRFSGAGLGHEIFNNDYFRVFLQLSVLLNLGLSFFNLIPIPPLDGSQILMGFLPPRRISTYLRTIRFAPTIFLALIVAEWAFHIPLFSAIIDPLWKPYLAFF
ncbi:MAG: site-2 protease family protein, partial [Chitinivibrionales bacterium]|nr:site-2 protease family protein [Chitinivibrionales bacterium]